MDKDSPESDDKFEVDSTEEADNNFKPEIITLNSNVVSLFYILKNAKVEQPLQKPREFEGNLKHFQ